MSILFYHSNDALLGRFGFITRECGLDISQTESYYLKKKKNTCGPLSIHLKTLRSGLFSAVLKLTAVDRGVVVIQGAETARYLAMSDEGRLYSLVSICGTPEDPCRSNSTLEI